MKKLFIALASLVLVLSMGGCTFDPNKALEDEAIFQEPEPEYEFSIEVLGVTLADRFDDPNASIHVTSDENTLMRIQLKVSNLTETDQYFYGNVFETPFYVNDGHNSFLVAYQYGIAGERLLYGETITGYVYVLVPKNHEWPERYLTYEYAYPSYDTITVEF